MDSSKRRITLKVFLSYFALALLTTIVGWLIFSEISSFSETQKLDVTEKNKILKVGKVITLMYESESIARAALQTNSKETLENYLLKNDTLNIEIDSLAILFESNSQIKLLDSIKILLHAKERNIIELRKIKSDPTSERSLQNAINKFSKIESSMGKLTIEEFVEHPEYLSEANRKNIEEYVSILNRYAPKSTENSMSQKTLDSIISASKTLLRDIKLLSYQQKINLSKKENELLKNELTISQKLHQILTDFEKEIENTASIINYEREKALSKSINVISIAAVIGVLLAIAFSILILNDFWKTQRYRKDLEIAAKYTSSLLKNREQLISGVSHDLRTPLSTILGYTELLSNTPLKDKESYYVKNIKNASNYVAKLVDDLLDFSKLEVGKIKIESVPFKLDQVIIETAESVQSNFKKPIELILKIDENLKKDLIGDPFRIQQILTNLIGNAYKFTEKGHVKITARGIKKNENLLVAQIDVEDTGIGIKKEKQSLIFDEFTQAEDSIEKNYGGTGLGLTISMKLAQLLNGKLFLESSENIGSTFTLQIPLKFSSHKSLNQPKTISKKLSIIIVDDDPVLLELNTITLQQQGFIVHSFKNASKALESIKKIDYDLIITDIQMPVMNGFRFLELLKTEKKYLYKNQPIIAITGRHDLKKEYYINSNFTDVIYKPYELQKLVSLIHQLFGHSKIMVNDIPQKKFSNYDLSSLKNILGNDDPALQQILKTFIKSTNSELIALDKAIKENNIREIKEIAHKMISMFRQIKANNVVTILDKMENLTISEKTKILESDFKVLKENIASIFQELNENTPV